MQKLPEPSPFNYDKTYLDKKALERSDGDWSFWADPGSRIVSAVVQSSPSIDDTALKARIDAALSAYETWLRREPS